MAKSGKKERPNVSVEASIARLDKIVERLESEETDLSEAIELFREGNELAKVCRGQDHYGIRRSG